MVEANKLRPILRRALKESCHYADEGISATNKRHTQCEIWAGAQQGLDDEELDRMAEIMTERATVNAAVAQVVRGIVNIYQEAEIAVILVPRFWATWQFYKGNGGFVLPL